MSSEEKFPVINSQQVYDRECMLREVLSSELANLMAKKYFDVIGMKMIRAITRDIQGLPEEREFDLTGVPKDVSRLHCVEFDSLSPINRHAGVVASMEYMGINDLTGTDLLGVEGWRSLCQRIDDLKLPPSEEKKAVKNSEAAVAVNEFEGIDEAKDRGKLSPWAQHAMSNIALEIFSGAHFSICKVDSLSTALKRIRKDSGLTPHTRNESNYAALSALHCSDYAAMDPTLCAGLKEAVWDACGIDDQIARIAFGEHFEKVQSVKVQIPASRDKVDTENDIVSQINDLFSPGNTDQLLGSSSPSDVIPLIPTEIAEHEMPGSADTLPIPLLCNLHSSTSEGNMECGDVVVDADESQVKARPGWISRFLGLRS